MILTTWCFSESGISIKTLYMYICIFTSVEKLFMHAPCVMQTYTFNKVCASSIHSPLLYNVHYSCTKSTIGWQMVVAWIRPNPSHVLLHTGQLIPPWCGTVHQLHETSATIQVFKISFISNAACDSSGVESRIRWVHAESLSMDASV